MFIPKATCTESFGNFTEFYNSPHEVEKCTIPLSASNNSSALITRDPPLELVVLLEKITGKADAIFSGVKIKTEYSFEESTRARYRHLPPTHYKVLTLTNLSPETQRLSTYWSSEPKQLFSSNCIKIFYPTGDKGQLPYVMTEETSDPTEN